MYCCKRTPGAFFLVILLLPTLSLAQSLGATGTINGTVVDQTGAVIPGAQIKIANPVTKYQSTAEAGQQGQFSVQNVPFNHYHITVNASGFSTLDYDVDLHTSVPLNLKLEMPLAASQTQVNVEGQAEDVVENEVTAHMDLDSELMSKLPAAGASAGLAAVIASSTPGVSNDSNGMFHPQGEHADTSFVIDSQPISDQTSKQFSNQISSNVVQSMELVTGVPPAEFGDKASLVVRTATKSGLGVDQPHGSFDLGYGSFGTSTADASLSLGNKTWGNFFSLDGMNSGRFLDTPEFQPLHDRGNAESFFDRVDYLFKNNDTLHLDLSLSRSWFQIPNTYDQEGAGQDQRQQIRSFNIAPGYTHLFNNNTLLTANAWVRQDRVGYYPSADVFDDQPATLSQQRRLTNTGFKIDLAYTKSVHNIKAGFQFSDTPLSEFFQVGLTDPLYNAVCVDSTGAAVVAPGITDPASCATAGFTGNPNFSAGLLPIDLTRGGQQFAFRGAASVVQEAAYIQDSITWKNFNIMLGVRGDNYDGLSTDHGIQPRVGLSYQSKKTGTVLRASYGRVFLTPYNENLILSSSTGAGGLENALGGFGERALVPARRNHFETGLQQGIDGWLVVDASYFWKFTDDDFDFDVILNTPLAFPIQWRKSKIDGFSIRVSMPDHHGLTAYSVMGHTRARFFGPETGGLLFNSPVDVSVFRIDHDQAFQQNTHVQYQPTKRSPWIGFTWSYESGEVAGEVPDFNTLLGLSGDQQQQAGLFCGSTFATPTSPIRSCPSNLGVTRLVIPQAGTYDADKNPARVAPRNLFDAAVGWDNIFHGDRYKWNMRLTATNLTNKDALYNLLSTFSGTHFVSPRTWKAELGFDF
jgi:hypothetical protein